MDKCDGDRPQVICIPGHRGHGDKKMRVEIEQGSPVSDKPARVLIYQGDKLIMEVVATIETRPGCHYDLSEYVALEKKEY